LATTVVLGISIVLQVAAAALAFRLIKITRTPTAWLLITSAISLMAFRRSITFYRLVTGDVSRPPDLTAEAIALLISVLMLAGIAWIAPLFRSIMETRDKLARTNEQLQQEITERHAAEAKLEAHRGHLEELVQERTADLSQAIIVARAANRAKTEFLANMSHELRTPLNAIIGFADMLERKFAGALNDHQTEYVHIINISGHHLLDLINDVLDLAKVEAGKMEMDRSWVNVGELLDSSAMLLREKAIAHALNVTVTKTEEVRDLLMRADARKFKQVVFNLLSNAVKFTPDGGRITITARREDDRLVVDVSDTGVGINAEDQARIFGEFEQVDSSPSKTHQGTGLGLALAKKLIEMHGGTIGVFSEGENRGTTFTFSIPTDEPRSAVSTPTATPPPEAPSTDTTGEARPLVLVVEDDKRAAEMLRTYLENGGFSVAHTTSGEQALRLAREYLPRAITLDIILPDKSGLEVLAELKADPVTSHIPVVIVSVTDRKRLAFTLGATEWLVKPVAQERLIEAVKRHRPPAPGGENKVLLLADEENTGNALAALLRANGFVVLHAGNGDDAIELAAKFRPQVAVLDLSDPVLTGIAVSERFRSHPRTQGIPLVIHTTGDLTEADISGLRKRFEGFAAKPGRDQLLREVQRVLRHAPGRPH
jgi:signal transduction histidine kinase/DNA-binding response OmpR family regulator